VNLAGDWLPVVPESPIDVMAVIERARTELQRVEDRERQPSSWLKRRRSDISPRRRTPVTRCRTKQRSWRFGPSVELGNYWLRSQNTRQDRIGRKLLPISHPSWKTLGEQDDSSRWQAVASVPEDRFDQHLAEQQTAGRELTRRACLLSPSTIAAQRSSQV